LRDILKQKVGWQFPREQTKQNDRKYKNQICCVHQFRKADGAGKRKKILGFHWNVSQHTFVGSWMHKCEYNAPRRFF